MFLFCVFVVVAAAASAATVVTDFPPHFFVSVFSLRFFLPVLFLVHFFGILILLAPFWLTPRLQHADVLVLAALDGEPVRRRGARACAVAFVLDLHLFVVAVGVGAGEALKAGGEGHCWSIKICFYLFILLGWDIVVSLCRARRTATMTILDRFIMVAIFSLLKNS